MAEFLGESTVDQVNRTRELASEKSSGIASNKEVIIINRRSFFGALMAIGTVGMGAILSAPVLRYILYPLYAKSSGMDWSDVGAVSDFTGSSAPVRKTISFAQRDGWREVVSAQSVYVNRLADDQFEVMSAICPHLGCSVSWQPGQDEFVCPCHGGRFAPNGRHISGPPPRGLDTLPTRVQNGKLQVQFEFFRSNVPNKEKLS
jgi:Rieske Fe-S protein